MLPIIEIHEDAAEELESVGSKEKFWFTRTDFDDTVRWLYKAARKIDEVEWTGEDWAEKVCEQLADRLGLPHATYDLATWKNTPGVISRRIAREELVLGNVVLAGFATEYPEVQHDQHYRIPQYTLHLMLDVLRNEDLGIKVDPDWDLPPDVDSAAGVFTGFLMLDAWVGNTDRHDRNWAILESRSGIATSRFLAPTFDHASSLGRELREVDRTERLNTNDQGYMVEAYSKKARSALFLDEGDKKPLLAVEAFQRFADYETASADAWLRRLNGIDDEDIHEILNDVPDFRMSDTAKQFVRRLLHHNRELILQV